MQEVRSMVVQETKNGGVSIRDFVNADLDRIWLLDQSCFEPGIAYDKHTLRYFLRQPGSFTLIAENSQNDLLGFMLMQCHPKDEKYSEATANIITIDIHPNARRSGTATKMFVESERRAKVGGCILMDLEVAVNNEGAIAFYKRHGFETTGRIEKYYTDTLDAFHMEKRLT